MPSFSGGDYAELSSIRRQLRATCNTQKLPGCRSLTFALLYRRDGVRHILGTPHILLLAILTRPRPRPRLASWDFSHLPRHVSWEK